MKRLFDVLAGFIGLASAASAQTAPLPFVLKQVGPGVYAAIDGPEHKAGSNAGLVIGDDGVLVVDAFFNPDAARALVTEIHRLTPKPIRYVVNTHYHADHTGGDQALRDAGAIIIAHRNVRGWVRQNNINLFGDRITPEQRAAMEKMMARPRTARHVTGTSCRGRGATNLLPQDRNRQGRTVDVYKVRRLSR